MPAKSNHKRLKLYIKAEELYPEDYDFSILFDTVSNRKLRRQMEKRHVEGEEIVVITLSRTFLRPPVSGFLSCISVFWAYFLSAVRFPRFLLTGLSDFPAYLLDELGSGTDPTEGMGIAIAILEELKKSGALFLVTTHYPEVKQYAEQEENVIIFLQYDFPVFF